MAPSVPTKPRRSRSSRCAGLHDDARLAGRHRRLCKPSPYSPANSGVRFPPFFDHRRGSRPTSRWAIARFRRCSDRRGTDHPINPRATEVQGLRAYPNAGRSISHSFAPPRPLLPRSSAMWPQESKRALSCWPWAQRGARGQDLERRASGGAPLECAVDRPEYIRSSTRIAGSTSSASPICAKVGLNHFAVRQRGALARYRGPSQCMQDSARIGVGNDRPRFTIICRTWADPETHRGSNVC
jgi:hypothetical protein